MVDRPDVFDLDVELVFHSLQAMSGAGKYKAFAVECKARNLKLTASSDLIEAAKTVLATIPAPMAAGPRCPACPGPGGA